MFLALQPSTWRLLGLGVAAGYASFGTFETLFPSRAAKELLDIDDTDPKIKDTVSSVFPLLGARDFTIAAALYTFYHTRKDKEMGAVILAGTILCAADTVAIGFRKGWGL